MANRIDLLAEQIESAPDLPSLELVKDRILTMLKDEVSALSDRVSDLSPLKDLMNVPTDPKDAIKWISKFVNTYISPSYKALLTCQSKILETQQSITHLTNAVQERKAQLEALKAIGG